MLTLTRRAGERILIGDDVEISVVDVGRGKVRIGITAPRGLAVHRGEVVDRIVRENRAAAASLAPARVSTCAPTRIEVPAGLPGLRAHRVFEVYDVEGQPDLRQLVSVIDPLVSLCIVDAELAAPGYPLEAARTLVGVAAPDAIVVLVVTAPRDGRPSTVNLAAPIVIDVGSRTAAQVILEGVELPSSRPLGAVRAA